MGVSFATIIWVQLDNNKVSYWLNEEILNFLERYQGETCIWDTGHPDHKDNKKKLAHGVALAPIKLKTQMLLLIMSAP
ncbi:unnamed protein product [Acanthoscelides obtectus]|uniref:Uncharacterized protein n=1 Tax=Acanthoscelides obtectus TaxID=200917 RepID=A0A9P0JP00_ACAOB|nr:unnamed protein product [Acanthoscelides obtectus]CAK1658071.1 hypothetical protein AOBTE_LOCUS20682 [Acanthoscelides obtectus]